METTYGTLYGVSVGPGDPELLTLKAKRILESCPVIAAPQTGSGSTLALDIAAGATDLTQKTLLPIRFLMTTDADQLAKSHAAAAEQVLTFLKDGQDVAMVTLGDISVFSTFSYLREAVLAAGCNVVIIPGVTSFCACAAVLGQSLTSMKEPLTIIPAAYGGVEDALKLPGTKVLMKSGKSFPQVRQLLADRGIQASAVANCGLPNEKVFQSLSQAEDDPGYFVTILVGGKD